MRRLLFSGAPRQPLPTTHRTRLYLEQLESRTLMSASHFTVPAFTATPSIVITFTAPPVNPGSPNAGFNIPVNFNNQAINVFNFSATNNLGNLNTLANNLVNSNNQANNFGNSNSQGNGLGNSNSNSSSTMSGTVNPNNSLQLLIFTPSATSLIVFGQSLASWLGYTQNAQTPPEQPVPGTPSPGQNSSGLGFFSVLPRQIIPAGNPNAIFEPDAQLKEAIPGAEPPPPLVPDAWFTTHPESFPEHKEEPKPQPLQSNEPSQQTDEARTVEDMTAELARAVLVDKAFLTDRHEVLDDTATALDRALASRLQEEQHSASESEQAMVVLATVNSPCGAVEVPATTEASAASE